MAQVSICQHKGQVSFDLENGASQCLFDLSANSLKRSKLELVVSPEKNCKGWKRSLDCPMGSPVSAVSRGEKLLFRTLFHQEMHSEGRAHFESVR